MMTITIDFVEYSVPQEIVRYCDDFTGYADHDDLRHIDCVYMHMGVYGGDPSILRQFRDMRKIHPSKLLPATGLSCYDKTDFSISGHTTTKYTL